MKLSDQIKFLKNAKKAYDNKANMVLEGNDVVLRNAYSGILHKFVDGRERVTISKKYLKKVKQELGL